MVVHNLRPHRRLGLLRLAVLLIPIVLGVPADAIRIRVSQESKPGAGDFHQHILGHIGAMQSDGAVDGVYAYNEWNRYSFNGKRPVLRANVSHLFFVEAQEGLTLFIVHDAVDNPEGGSAAMRIRVVGNRHDTKFLLRDDAFSENDDYTASVDGTSFNTWHNWYACCTDGVVLGPFAGTWKIYVQFRGDDNAPDEQVVDGLDGWEALSSQERIRLKLEKERRVLLEPAGSFVLKQHLDWASLTTRLRH